LGRQQRRVAAPSMATPATGIPGGICAVDKSASSPASDALMGTPITGAWCWRRSRRQVGRLARRGNQRPKTVRPRFAGKLLRERGRSVADRTRTSKGISRRASASAAPCMTARSLSLPHDDGYLLHRWHLKTRTL
jgi:hypothetical protein